MELPFRHDYSKTWTSSCSRMHSRRQTASRSTLLRACVGRGQSLTPILLSLLNYPSASSPRGHTRRCHQYGHYPEEHFCSRPRNVREQNREEDQLYRFHPSCQVLVRIGINDYEKVGVNFQLELIEDANCVARGL